MRLVLSGVLVLLALSIGSSMPRWLRVAQREHYLAGETLRFALRWWRSSLANLVLIVLAVVCCVVSLWWPVVAAFVAIACAIGPIGLSVRGRTSKLAWTRRLRLLAGVLCALMTAAIVLVCLRQRIGEVVIVAGVIALLLPIVIDAALMMTAPLENYLAKRFVSQAKRRLDRVRPMVVAITGSYGKTTTKGYVAHLLEKGHVVVASPRSFNNRAGLARTVNEFVISGTEILIAEMGAYGQGEIRALCSWMRPTIAVITAIGPVHLERFKDLAVTLAAKAEIAEDAEVVVLNVDDPRLASLVGPLRQQGKRVITCSAQQRSADVCIREESGALRLWLSEDEIGRCAVDAEHRPGAITNVACAMGVAIALGDDPRMLLDGLCSLPQAANRLTTTRGSSGVAILDDTFNSNPAGASLALDLLARTGSPTGRRVLVTPGMIELGSLQYDENRKFVEHASKICSDIVIVGRTNRLALRTGAAKGVHVEFARTREEAVSWVRTNLGDGDAVLYENDLPDHYA